MADEFVRQTFTRYRLGGGGTLNNVPGFLRVLNPSAGSPQILDPISGLISLPISAEIRVKAASDVRVDDILKTGLHTIAGRVFIVRQVKPEADANLFQCAEIRHPIPDEFDAQSLGPFWATGLGLGSWAFLNESQGGIAHMDSMPNDTKPIDDGYSLFQPVSGDFDVWSRLRTDAGSAGNVRNALLGVRHTGSLTGCWIGIRDNGLTGEPVRYDVYTGSPNFDTDTNTGFAAFPATYYYVRLKRIGNRFRTFYKTSPGEPVTESDWTEITNDPATSFVSTSEPLRLELFGFTNNSTQGEARFQFLRNWVPEMPTGAVMLNNIPICVHRNTASVGNAGGGLDNLHSFTLPAGSLAQDGDYLDIEYGGDFSVNDNDKRLQFSVGGSAVFTMGLSDLDSSLGWKMLIKVIRVSATSVRVSPQVICNALSMTGAGAVGAPGGAGAYIEVQNAVVSGLADLNSNGLALLVQGEGTSNDDVIQNLSIIELCRQ